MPKKIHLTIPKPCHEQWNTFIPTAQGGFCGSCQKEVIDFTNWSEERLKAYFKNPPSNACGRFKDEQLKVYSYEQTQSLQKGWVAFVFTSVLMLFSSRQVTAQVAKPKALTEQLQPGVNRRQVMTSSPDSVISLRGTVTSFSDSSLLADVTILYKGDTIATTDEFGKFACTISKSDLTQVIIFYSPGLGRERYAITPGQAQEDITIVMGAWIKHVVVGGAISVCVINRPWYSPKRWWYGIKGWF